MKTFSQLSDFYYEKLHGELKELDSIRASVVHRTVVLSIIYIAIAFVVAFKTNLIIPSLFVCIIAIFITFSFLKTSYVSRFKDSIFLELIGFIDSSLVYFKDSFISQSIFERSNLFPAPARYSGNDYVKGSIDGVSIEFSDIEAKDIYTDSKGREHVETTFKGLYIVAKFNKNFRYQTIVLPDMAKRFFGDVLGRFLQSFNSFKGELVKMDDIEFDKNFVVYSKDQIEARYILSNSLMPKIVELKNRAKSPLYLSFVDSSIHIALYTNKDMFEPPIFSSLLEYKNVKDFLEVLMLTSNIVEELNLNKNLWSDK